MEHGASGSCSTPWGETPISHGLDEAGSSSTIKCLCFRKYHVLRLKRFAAVHGDRVSHAAQDDRVSACDADADIHCLNAGIYILVGRS